MNVQFILKDIQHRVVCLNWSIALFVYNWSSCFNRSFFSPFWILRQFRPRLGLPRIFTTNGSNFKYTSLSKAVSFVPQQERRSQSVPHQQECFHQLGRARIKMKPWKRDVLQPHRPPHITSQKIRFTFHREIAKIKKHIAFYRANLHRNHYR